MFSFCEHNSDVKIPSDTSDQSFIQIGCALITFDRQKICLTGYSRDPIKLLFVVLYTVLISFHLYLPNVVYFIPSLKAVRDLNGFVPIFRFYFGRQSLRSQICARETHNVLRVIGTQMRPVLESWSLTQPVESAPARRVTAKCVGESTCGPWASTKVDPVA